jgi:hypothetical protein
MHTVKCTTQALPLLQQSPAADGLAEGRRDIPGSLFSPVPHREKNARECVNKEQRKEEGKEKSRKKGRATRRIVPPQRHRVRHIVKV